MSHGGGGYARRFDDNGAGRFAGDDRGGFQKRPRFEEERGRFGGGRGGFDQPSLDEDILVCPNYGNWRARAQPEATVEDYMRFVPEWLRHRNEKFAERHWREDWYLGRYDPARAEERHLERQSGVQKRAESLDYASLVELVAAENGRIVYGPEPIQVPENRAVYIPNIPPHVPRVAAERLFESEGAEHVLFSDVHRARKRRDLGRRATVVFKEQQLAKDCLAKGSLTCWLTVDADGVHSEGVAVKDDQRSEVQLRVTTFKPFPNRLLPVEAATEARMKKDQDQALLCAETLDQAFQVKPEHGIRVCLERRPKSVSELDATVQYLRYVHLYCYYSGTLARDFGELMHKAAAPFVRPNPAANGAGPVATGGGEEEDVQDPKRFFEGTDAAADRTVKRFAGEAFAAERAFMVDMVARREQISNEAFDEFMRKSLVMKGSHVYCAFHDKLFQNETFFRKHLHNFHGASVRAELRRALYGLMLQMFERDEDKPLPRLQRFVEEALQGTFVPPEPSYPRGSGVESYQQRRYEPREGSWAGGGAPSRSGGRTDHGQGFSEPPPPLAPLDSMQQPAPLVRKYRDPDAPQEAAAVPKPTKLQYRTRVSYEGT